MIVQKFTLKNLKQEAEEQTKRQLGKEQASIPEMIDYIIETYHKPELELMAQIEQDFGESRSSGDIYSLFERLKQALEEHFEKEEKEIFPLMKDPGGFTRENLIKVLDLENEHSQAEKQVIDLQQRTNYFAVPDGADESVRKAYRKMEELTSSLLSHVDYENNTLFPKYEDEVNKKMG